MISSQVEGGANERMRMSSALLFDSWLEVEAIAMLLMWRSGEEELLTLLIKSFLLLSLGENPICFSFPIRMIGKPGVHLPDLEAPSVPVPCFEYCASGWGE